MTNTFFNILPSDSDKTWPDVEVEETNGHYYAWCEDVPSLDLRFIEVRPLNYHAAYLNSLTDSQIESGIQIFYDRWNFGTGSIIDKNRHEIFQIEKNRRMASRIPNTGDLACGPVDGVMKVYDGTRWIVITASETKDESIDT